MFDFQKLEVYKKSKSFFWEAQDLIKKSNFDRPFPDQLRRASLSISLNIAESSSRFSHADRRHFLTIARGSAFECVAILEILKESKNLEEVEFEKNYGRLQEISKMLFGLIKSLNKQT